MSKIVHQAYSKTFYEYNHGKRRTSQFMPSICDYGCLRLSCAIEILFSRNKNSFVRVALKFMWWFSFSCIIPKIIWILFIYWFCQIWFILTVFLWNDKSKEKSPQNLTFSLTLSWRRPISYRNQSIDLQSKSMDWFLYNIGLRHERVNLSIMVKNQSYLHFLVIYLQLYLEKQLFGCIL